MVASVPATLQQVGENDIVGGKSCSDHVILQGQSAIQIMLINECLDQQRICYDVGTPCLIALHVLIEIQRLRQAVPLHETFHEERGHYRAHALIRALEVVGDLSGGLHVIVRDTSIEQRSHGDIIRREAVAAHFLDDFGALHSFTSLREALHDGVVRDDIHEPMILGVRAASQAPFEGVGFLQHSESTLWLLCVRVGEKKEVEHEGVHPGSQFLEKGVGSVCVSEGDINAKKKHILLCFEVALAVLREHDLCAQGGADLESSINETREDDLIGWHLVTEERVRREALSEVLPAGKHPQGGLPECKRRRHPVTLHGAQHPLHHIDLPDAHRPLDEGGVKPLAEVISAIALESTISVQGDSELLALLELLQHLLLRGLCRCTGRLTPCSERQPRLVCDLFPGSGSPWLRPTAVWGANLAGVTSLRRHLP
mmetsp:Transcript_134114/g.286778  ORF Transcript_134114/g.286778 Transcript_134114/m.286778 type:complete len:427 (-) Transcript_134114:280-1560(-)